MNITRFLAFDTNTHTRDGNRTPTDQLEAASSEVKGTNDYYSLAANAQELPLRALPQAKQDRYLALVAASQHDEFTLMLGLEPPKLETPEACFIEATTSARLEQTKLLGRDLALLQQQIRLTGKTLRVVIRIASEMNPQAGNKWSGKSVPFKSAYRKLALALRAGAQAANHQSADGDFQLSFSPLINKNAALAKIKPYWPGDDVVDLVGCTYYSRDGDKHEDARKNLADYFREFAKNQRQCCIDEFGCGQKPNLPVSRTANNAFYRSSITWLKGVDVSARVDHCTLFLLESWQGDLGVIL